MPSKRTVKRTSKKQPAKPKLLTINPTADDDEVDSIARATGRMLRKLKEEEIPTNDALNMAAAWYYKRIGADEGEEE